MPYCHKCGKKLEEKDSFCSLCGAGIKEVLEDAKEEVEKIIDKTSSKGIVIFIIFLVVAGYVVLDIWAISQLRPVVSLDSVWNSILNFEGDVDLFRSSASTEIRVENPTFVPILFGKISYEAKYGTSLIGDGKTGFFIIGPHSEKDIYADLEVRNLEVIKAVGKETWGAVGNFFRKLVGAEEKKTEDFYVDMYSDFIITKFKVGTIG